VAIVVAVAARFAIIIIAELILYTVIAIAVTIMEID